MTFFEVLLECCQQPELINQFNRLSGTKLMVADTRAPIIRMIDESTGYEAVLNKETERAMHGFIGFVYFYIWLPYCWTLARELKP